MTDPELTKKCDDHQFHVHERDSHEQAVQALKIEIGTELALRGLDRIDLSRHTAMEVVAHRKTLDQHKLLEAGVTMDQIAAATVESESRSLRILDRIGVDVTAIQKDPEAPKVKKSHHKKKPEGTAPPIETSNSFLAGLDS